jgi:hypothetical protein
MKKILFAFFTISILIACQENQNNPYRIDKTGGDFLNLDKKDPWADNIICLWCGKSISSSVNPKILFNPDINNPWKKKQDFTNSKFCGLKCFNEFKNSYLNNKKIDMKYIDSSKTYQFNFDENK